MGLARGAGTLGGSGRGGSAHLEIDVFGAVGSAHPDLVGVDPFHVEPGDAVAFGEDLAVDDGESAARLAPDGAEGEDVGGAGALGFRGGGEDDLEGVAGGGFDPASVLGVDDLEVDGLDWDQWNSRGCGFGGVLGAGGRREGAGSLGIGIGARGGGGVS